MIEEFVEDEYSRTVEDLISIYEEESTIKDVFVEGEYDKHFIDFFFDYLNIENVTIYEISSIAVTEQYFEVLGLQDKNCKKNQVISLSYELFKKLNSYKQVRCIVDKDMDDYFEKPLFDWETLLYTDYTSREMYFLNPKTIKKFIKLNLYGLSISENELIDKICEVLQEIFLIRLTLKRIGSNAKLVPFSTKKRCPSSKFNIKFKKLKYIKDLINSRAISIETDNFIDIMDKFKKKLSNSYRNNIRGHDFSILLAYFLNKNYKKKINKKQRKFDEINVEAALYCCIEVPDLLKENLFNELWKWALS